MPAPLAYDDARDNGQQKTGNFDSLSDTAAEGHLLSLIWLARNKLQAVRCGSFHLVTILLTDQVELLLGHRRLWQLSPRRLQWPQVTFSRPDRLDQSRVATTPPVVVTLVGTQIRQGAVMLAASAVDEG